jgi:hypothetical protein
MSIDGKVHSFNIECTKEDHHRLNVFAKIELLHVGFQFFYTLNIFCKCRSMEKSTHSILNAQKRIIIDQMFCKIVLQNLTMFNLTFSSSNGYLQQQCIVQMSKQSRKIVVIGITSSCCNQKKLQDESSRQNQAKHISKQA